MSYVPILSSDAAAALAGARVLVTGASGFVGSQLVRQGVAAGVAVHTLGRRPGPEGSTHHPADLTDAAAVAAVVAQVAPAAVLHLAAPGVAFGSASLGDMLRVLVQGTEALLTACAALPVRPRIVHVGSGFEYALRDRAVGEDDPLVPAGSVYGAAKAAASATVGAFAGTLAVTLLRPFHIYGAGEAPQRLGPHLVARARAGEAVAVTACEQVRDFLHVDDTARCLWNAAAEPGVAHGLTVLNLGSGTPITLRAYVDAMIDALAAAGIVSDVRFGAIPYRVGEPMVSIPDLTRLRATLDWQPRIDLARGCADMVAWSLSR